MELDQSTLKFSAAVAEFSKPYLKFDLDLDQINLDRYMPPKSEQPSAKEETSEACRIRQEKKPIMHLCGA